jgi:hypothetical protein
MGIKLFINKDLPCVNFSFEEWDNFKESFTKALFNCIEHILILGEYKKNIDYITAKNLETDLNEIINDDVADLSPEQIDTLIFFDLSGIYYFVNKDTFQSNFSIGNAYDIFITLKILKDYFKQEELNLVNDFINIFKVSFNKKEKVIFL